MTQNNVDFDTKDVSKNKTQILCQQSDTLFLQCNTNKHTFIISIH
jgi:hypothetical protein